MPSRSLQIIWVYNLLTKKAIRLSASGARSHRLSSLHSSILTRHMVSQERDSLKAQIHQVISLQECADLKTQLQTVLDRLNQFRSIALAPSEPVEFPTEQSVLPLQATYTHKPQSPQQPEHKPKPLSNRISPEQRIEIAIQALIQYNRLCSYPHDRWIISGNSIAQMSSTNPATKIKPWLESHPDTAHAITLHNQIM